MCHVERDIRAHLNMDLVWHQAHHALSRHLMSPPPPLPFSIAPLARARSPYLCGASALGRVSMHALVCRCWTTRAGEREKRIAEKGRTHQLPSSCPRRSSCTQKRLRCRHTHRQPAWFEIQNMCAVTRALIGAYGYTHQASLAAHMHVMCYIELYLISLFVTLYMYIQISCR